MDNVQNLLNEVSSIIKALDKAKQLYGEQLAPDFNVFNYIGFNETNLSYILNDLLNPTGSHNQKDLFLRKFIQICVPLIQEHWQDFLPLLSQVSAKTEEYTFKTAESPYRRMDIYLSAKNDNNSFGICIENKPYARDEPQQLIAYYDELIRRKHNHQHIIYLNERNQPSEDSVPKETLNKWIENNQFTHLKFSELIPWLNACKLECQNHSVIEFINHFIKFIQMQFMGVEDVSENEEILKLMRSSSDNIESAIKISSNIFEMKIRLIQKLFENLTSLNESNYSKSEENLPKYDLILGEMKGRVDDKILFGIPNSKLTISFAFNGTGFNSPYIGIFLPNINLEQDNIFASKVLKVCSENILVMDGKVKSDLGWQNGSWLSWYYFNKPNWYIESEFWGKSSTQQFAEDILKEVNTIYKILKDNDLLNYSE